MTNLFLDFFPGYNKFRAPTMILVLAELVIPIIALMGLKKIIEQPEIIKTKQRYFLHKVSVLQTGVSLLFYLFPGIFGLISNADLSAFASYTKQGATDSVINEITSNLEMVRKSILSADAIKKFSIHHGRSRIHMDVYP